MLEIKDLRTYLDIQDVSKDEKLKLAISNAKGFVSDYLWYSIEYNAERVAIFCGKNTKFELPFTDVIAVSLVEQGSDEFDTLTTYSWNTKLYKEGGILKTQEEVGPHVEITYAFWYDCGENAVNPTPEWLKYVLLSMASKVYKNMGETSMGDIKSETVDGDSITFKDGVLSGLTETEMNILAKYKRYGFSA